MSKGYFVDRAVEEAEFVLQRIDRKWPVGLVTCGKIKPGGRTGDA
jgi:hypothetical protein